MTHSPFFQIQGKMIRLDSIAYVDFLDSGRAMIFMRGLTQEKQNIAVDPADTIRLRAILERYEDPEVIPEPSLPKSPENRRWS